jgi:SAM-dependent methyltransferase
MNLAMVALSILFLPLFLALRWPFFRLPLHVDTGFYVSNHTICTRRIEFSKGWNAEFAGCSKVIAEFFYSAVYLLHGGKDYKSYSRFYYSFYNYAIAMLIGYTSYLVGGQVESLYYLGLVTYSLVSSEPHYGIYFESGEQFELLFQVLGFLLIVFGIEHRNAYLVALGFASWLFDGFFIKLTALISSGVLAVGIALAFPESLPHLAVAGLIGAGSYVAWILVNGKNPFRLLRPLIGHEYHYGHRLGIGKYASRLFVKTSWLLWQVTRSLPIIPALAVLGWLVIHPGVMFLLGIYLLAVVGAYFFQATRVWYYTLPLIPGMAILAASAVLWVINLGPKGIVAAIALGLLWLAIHLIQSYGRLLVGGVASLNLYAWRPHGSAMAEKNFHLDEMAPSLAACVRGRSLFVCGSWNQAYVLLESSYDTPLVCAAHWLDSMVPGWQRVLNERFLQEPPAFLLDTDECFEVEVIKQNLGLDYRSVGSFGPFRLFGLNSSERQVVNLDCEPFDVKGQRRVAKQCDVVADDINFVQPRETDARCPVCFGEMVLWLAGMFDDRYGMPGLYDLVRCAECGLVKTMPSLREQELERVYSTYYPRRDVDLTALSGQARDPKTTLGRLTIWLSGADNQGHYSAAPGMKVLDYGCGVGISLLELRAIGAEGYGVEADPNVKRVAEHFGLNVHVGALEEAPFSGIKFDLISLNQVIEHVPEPGHLLRKLRSYVHGNSIVVLSFPNVDSLYRRLFHRRWINWHVPYHIHHFNHASFAKLCTREGWILTRWKTVTPNLWTILQLRSLLIAPRMGVTSRLWMGTTASTQPLRADTVASEVSTVGALVLRLRRARQLVTVWLANIAFAAVNRLIDLLGLGDSVVVFLRRNPSQ